MLSDMEEEYLEKGKLCKQLIAWEALAILADSGVSAHNLTRGVRFGIAPFNEDSRYHTFYEVRDEQLGISITTSISESDVEFRMLIKVPISSEERLLAESIERPLSKTKIQEAMSLLSAQVDYWYRAPEMVALGCD
jgi:hypothetical protein